VCVSQTLKQTLGHTTVFCSLRDDDSRKLMRITNKDKALSKKKRTKTRRL
jgi:hypothetical protein